MVASIPKYRLLPSVRLFMCFLVFVGITVNLSLFSTIYFAWVCMVNDTTTTVSNLTFDSSKSGELNWGKQMQQHIFAGYHIGGAISLFFSGTLINKFGSKLVFASGLLLEVIATALIPLATQLHYLVVTFLRVLTGFGSSVLFPVAYEASAHWAAKREMGAMLALCLGGIQFGITISLVFDGMECKYLDWSYIFYLSALVAALFLILWMVFYSSDPTESRWVSDDEQLFILANRNRTEKKKVSIPYKSIFKSMAVWSCVGASMGTGIVGFLAQFLPTYFKEVHNLEVSKNGFFSAVGPLGMLIGRCVSGPLSDKKFGFKTHEPVVKIFNTFALGGSALSLLTMTFVTKDTPQPLILVLLFIFYFVFIFVTGGFLKSPLYIAPQYSGFIGSMHMAANYSCAIALPYLISLMTPNGTEEEWHHVFYTIMVLASGSAAFFLIFGKGELQPWARTMETFGQKPSTMSMISMESEKEAGYENKASEND